MKKIWSAAALMALLNFASPADIKAQSSTDISKEKTEVVVWLDMLNSIQQKTWVNLPNEYKQKTKDFLDYSKIFKDKDAREFTENFITKQMKEDRWISKENQQLFVLYSIFEYTVNEDIYDGEDWDETRLQEFENAVELIDNCGKLYVEELTQHMKILSAKSREQSAKNREIIEKNIKKRFMEDVPGFYQKYITNPQVITQNDIDFMRKSTKSFVDDCKKYWHDYKALMLEAVWDKRKVEEMLKFYGVE